MKFVKREDIKDGMRLAKPIYNKKGVLLYERDSKLTKQSIESVRNFGLIGVYVLEPAEPLPPMTDEDIDIEKFQIISEFALMDELVAMNKTGRSSKIRYLSESYISQFTKYNHAINFVQNLRGAEDYVFKHSSNVAILCTLICNKLRLRYEEKSDTIIAALVHDVGKLNIPADLVKKEDLTPEDIAEMKGYELRGADIIDESFTSTPAIKRTMIQAYRHLEAFDTGKEKDGAKMVRSAKILAVSDMFDQMTAMSVSQEPMSYISAIKFLMSFPDWFDPDIVKGLVNSINLLNEGTSVELSNGEKALVLAANPDNLLKPMVLVFSTNTIIDLARSSIYQGLEVVDTMKTLDERYVMDEETIKKLKGGT